MQLKYVTAADIRRVFDPIAPRRGFVRIDDARNLVTLSVNRQDITKPSPGHARTSPPLMAAIA